MDFVQSEPVSVQNTEGKSITSVLSRIQTDIQNPATFQTIVDELRNTDTSRTIGLNRLPQNNFVDYVRTDIATYAGEESTYGFDSAFHFSKSVLERSDRGYFDESVRAKMAKTFESLGYIVEQYEDFIVVQSVAPRYGLHITHGNALYDLHLGYNSMQDEQPTLKT